MLYIDQYEVEALLGRSLTNIEERNFDLYLKIAITKLEDLICIDLEKLMTELETDELPADLKLVLARLFGVLHTESTQEIGVDSKRVEDFEISYNDNTNKVFALTVQQNSATIMKYSKCVSIRSGKTIYEDCKYYDGLR